MSIHLKRLSIICVLAIFLIGANSNSNEVKSSKNENQISFETLQTMIQYLDERLSRLEEKPQQGEKQQQDPSSDNALKKNTISKVNKRLTKIEKTILTLDIKERQKTLKSFDETLDVFKKRLSELSKRLEDSEVNSAVVEKMYRKTQDYVGPLKDTVSKTKEEQFQVIRKDSGNTVQEKSTEEREESGGLRTSIVPKALTKSKTFQDIGNGLSAKNVTFDKYVSSSVIKGEIKNNSDNDITTASFTMKLFGENGKIIAEFDFHIRKIASNAIKPFEETARGVLPSQISRYEIKCRSTF